MLDTTDKERLAAETPHLDLAHQPLEAVEINGRPYHLLTLTDAASLVPFVEAWAELADHAATPNAFYEPWFLLPAMNCLSNDQTWRIVLVFRSDSAGRPAEMVGFFPFEFGRTWRVLRQLKLWQHPFCFLTNPLLRAGEEANCWRALLAELNCIAPGCQILEFPILHTGGSDYVALVEVLRDQLLVSYCGDEFPRAELQMPDDAEAYLSAALGGRHVRELRRQRRRLESLGQVEYRELHDPRGAEMWIDSFLQLEAAGWKGNNQTAMQTDAGQSAFFRQMVRLGMARQKIDFAGLFLNGEPIAMRCDLQSGSQSYHFKICFDESHRKYSPGVQLEIESLRAYAASERIQQIDSCAIPNHSMINRLWKERRLIRSLRISTGGLAGDLALGLRPLLTAANRQSRRIRSYLRRATNRITSPNNKTE